MPRYLVTINTDHPVFDGRTTTPEALHSALAGDFGRWRDAVQAQEPKCETCRHWCKCECGECGTGTCYEERDIVSRRTWPDFFCALWGGKQ